MNLCEALIIVRNCALASEQTKTRRGAAALKVIDRKIQGLLRKKGWRESYQAMPIHAAKEDFLYPIPDTTEPDTKRLDWLLSPGSLAELQAAIDGIPCETGEAWLKIARRAIDGELAK